MCAQLYGVHTHIQIYIYIYVYVCNSGFECHMEYIEIRAERY